MSDTTQQISDEDFFDEMTADELSKMRVRMATLESAVQLALRENEATRCGLREDVCRALIESLASPAEPSPAPPAERVIEVAPQGHSVWTPEKEQEMLEKAAGRVERMNPNDNEANMIAAVLRETLPEVAPQEEIPPRPPKQPAVHGCGEIYLVPDVEDYVKRMESSLTAAREERDRARDALRELDRYVRLGLGAIELGITEDGNIGIWLANEEKTLCKGDTVADAIAALNPVSDRQPAGETK